MTLLSLDEVRLAFPQDHQPCLETLRRYIRAGSLSGRKVGTTWYVSSRALEKFFEGTPAPPAEKAREINLG